MGESDRYQDYKESRKRRFSLGYDGNALMGLFTLIMIFFLLILTVQVCYNFFQQPSAVFNSQVIQAFSLPASFTKLSTQPWSIITYMFSESSSMIFRLVGNLLWLWAFGYLLQSMAGNDKLIPIFLYSGFVGGLAFMAANAIIPSLRAEAANAYLLGSNPAVMGVAMATTALSPNYRFFTRIRNGIPIWVLMAFFLIIDLVGFTTSSAAHSISHVMGAAAGAGFVFLLRRGYDLSTWMINFYNWVMNLFNPNAKKKKDHIKERVFYNTGNRAPYSKQAIITQQRVDEILDKINQRGYQFLTDEEKQILKKASEEDL